MREVAGCSSGLGGRSTPASGSSLPSRPIVASCGSDDPTVSIPATALYAIARPPTVTELSVTESAGSADGFATGSVAVVVVVVVFCAGGCARLAEDTRRLNAASQKNLLRM